MTEGIRQDMWRVEEEDQIGLWLNAVRGERVVKKRNGKKRKGRKKKAEWRMMML